MESRNPITYLFLYSELAEYTLACLRAAKKMHPENQFFIIHFPINPEAPFKFNFDGIGTFRQYTEFENYQAFIRYINETVQPDKIICSGWIHKWYIKACFAYRNKATCVLTLDNHWYGNLKQQVLRLTGSWMLRAIFRKVWVPGSPQQEYARKMGFRDNTITTGFYSCDTDKFLSIGNSTLPEKRKHFPKVLLCVARYIPAKGYRELWNAFIQWQSEQPNDWELWCAGKGEEYDQRIEHPKIKHLGFVQKDEWDQIIRSTGVFILLSKVEPWGVVVHEFAAAGYPLIISNKVGAAEAFVHPANGWIVQPDDQPSLLAIFKQLDGLSNDELIQMASASQESGKRIRTETWAASLAAF